VVTYVDFHGVDDSNRCRRTAVFSMRLWRHERSVTPDGATAIVRDRITFQLRAGLRFATPVAAAGIGALFSHRHHRLQRHFADAAVS
jgi:ligand-binding SRPBCC domain-containing protein